MLAERAATGQARISKLTPPPCMMDLNVLRAEHIQGGMGAAEVKAEDESHS
jgi:hypothetical protein